LGVFWSFFSHFLKEKREKKKKDHHHLVILHPFCFFSKQQNV